ncbi:chorismate mutase [Saccharopolyspora shandongensis]|uniref:chorismate mutase n=1 Tax=Saccharopolyspora shandongensis TaxID=418495 RepID=UPI00344993BE
MTRSLISMPGETVDGGFDVLQLRRRIDDIDQSIIDLIRTCKEISRRVQRTPTDVGGPRVEPVREAEITNSYHVPFGDAGSALAAALLQICRG